MNNMYEKGAMNRAVNFMSHDVFSSTAALQSYFNRLEKVCAMLMEKEETKALGEEIWDSVWRSKKEREGIIAAMDGFYKEFKAGFPDHLTQLC